MTYMPLRTVTIDLGNLRGQIFSRTEFAPSAALSRGKVKELRYGFIRRHTYNRR